MIKNIEKKLSGELPVNRYELITLVNSWGRIDGFPVLFEKMEAKECYPLENLDISQINDLSYVFSESPYNGDLSKWDISNVLLMNRMFDCSKFNNDSISKWNISNVIDFSHMFYSSKFDKDISSWEFNKNSYCYCIFFQNNNFEKKYNNGIEDIKDTNDFFKWFEENRDKIKEINTPKEKILEFFNFENNINLDKNI